MKAAIIGMGGISATHIAAIKSSNLAKLCAICDVNGEKLTAAMNKICDETVNQYTDYKEMIISEKPDVVHICTPHHLHRDMAVFALENGCNVYLEKPSAMNAKEATDIVKASEKSGKKVCVSFQNRVIPTNAYAKKLITDGKYGALMGIRAEMTWNRTGSYYSSSDWRGTWEKEGGGVLMNQSIHTLDLMYYFCGNFKSLEGSVALRKNKNVIEVEDTAEATIWFENGVEGIFYATNCNFEDSSVQIELFFEKASFLLYKDALYLQKDNGLEMLINNSDCTRTEGKACWGIGHVIMIDAFYNAINGGNDYYCDIKDSIPVLHMIDEIYNTSANKLK